MTKQEKIAAGPFNVHRKLSLARQEFHKLELKKSGRNTFAGYSYFELGDFIVPALGIFDALGLGTTPVTFKDGVARMEVVDLDNPTDRIEVESPMGSAALKGCHEVQNIGAVETYQRRYLWTNLLEIVEHAALDASTGKVAPEQRQEGGMPDAEHTKLQQLVQATKTNVPAMFKALGIKGAKDLRDITQDEYPRVVEALENKLAKMAKDETDAKAKEPA